MSYLIAYIVVCFILGFTVGTAVAHIWIYAKVFREGTPLRGISAFAIFLIIGLGFAIFKLYDRLSPDFGEGKTALIGVGVQLVGLIIGFSVRRQKGIGPSPPDINSEVFNQQASFNQARNIHEDVVVKKGYWFHYTNNPMHYAPVHERLEKAD